MAVYTEINGSDESFYGIKVTYGIGVAGITVENRVPHGVQVADAVLAWNVLVISTAVAVWVGGINFSG